MRRGRVDTGAAGDAAKRGTRARRRVAPRGWWRYVAGVAILGLLVYAAVEARRSAYARQLPSLPELTKQTASVSDHIRAADRAARANPGSTAVVGALCLAYHADMFYEEADRCYAFAQRRDPSEWRWTYYRALVNGDRGSGDGLTQGMREVVEAVPDFGLAWWRLGEAEFKGGRYDRAEEAYRRATTAAELPPVPEAARIPRHAAGAPVSAYASVGLARVALMRGDAASARRLLERVTSEARGFGPAWRLLGEAYEALGRGADATRATRTADRLPTASYYADPMVDALLRESRHTTFLLQEAAKTAVQIDAAWREFLTRRALEFDRDNADVVHELATLLRALGRHEEALELLWRHQQLLPGDAQGLADIGQSLARLGRSTEAGSYLRRALETDDNPNTRYDLAMVLAQIGRTDEAVAEYQKALDLNPNHLNARNNLAAMLARSGKLREAEIHLQRVLAAAPEHADAHTNLGIVFAARGQFDRAARELQEALRINPGHLQAQDALRAMGTR